VSTKKSASRKDGGNSNNNKNKKKNQYDREIEDEDEEEEDDCNVLFPCNRWLAKGNTSEQPFLSIYFYCSKGKRNCLNDGVIICIRMTVVGTSSAD